MLKFLNLLKKYGENKVIDNNKWKSPLDLMLENDQPEEKITSYIKKFNDSQLNHFSHDQITIWRYKDRNITNISDIKPLVNSIQNEGQQQPCIVRKDKKDGYRMMVTPLNWDPRPIILKLDYNLQSSSGHITGGLSQGQLHCQIRQHLQLKPEDCLRIRQWRPWLMYMVKNFPIPESSEIFCENQQCRYLLGTTLLICWWKHDHHTALPRREFEDDEGRWVTVD